MKSKDTILQRALPVLTAIFIIGVITVNFSNQIFRAHHKPLWLDENYSLTHTVQGLSYHEIILKAGKRFETNPSPLDFIFVKLLDDLRPAVNSFGLSFEAYYRLWANVAVHASCLFACGILLFSVYRNTEQSEVKCLQYAVISLIPFSILFRPLAYHYTAEVRPYALWFALWLVHVSVLTVLPRNKKVIFFAGILLSLSMVASVFQLLASAAALFIVYAYGERMKSAFRHTALIYILPIILVIFYAFPASYGNREIAPISEEWSWFIDFWIHEATVIPMMIFSSVILLLSKEERFRAAGPLSVLILFLVGPVIFWLTKHRGYFVTNRQYIYYDIHRAAFLISCVYTLPLIMKYTSSNILKRVIAVVFILSLVPLSYTRKHINRFSEAVQQAGFHWEGYEVKKSTGNLPEVKIHSPRTAG